MSMRREFDTMGEIEVPADRYWGAQTARSLANFKIGVETIPSELIRALGVVKKAAASANAELGELEPHIADFIIRAAARADP